MKRDFATTFITEALVVASYLLAFRLVAGALGTAGFGEYALARRTLAVLAPLGVLSLDIAVARYVAYGTAADLARSRRYPAAAVLLVAGAALILGGLLLLLQGPLAYVFFGSSRYSGLIVPMPLLILGGALHGVAYGFLRGSSKIQRANVLMAVNMAAIPILAITFFGGSVASILTAMGALWIVVSVGFLVSFRMSFEGVRASVVELTRYGVPRVPGELIRLTLFALPGILIAHATDVAVAGGVAFGVAAVGMLGTALTPIGFVMLPAAARMLAEGSTQDLRRQVVQIVRLAVLALSLAIVGAELFAPQIVAVYLGPQFASTATALRVVVPAALPWGIYMSLSSVIDAHHIRPVNARNMAIAFAVFLVISAVLTLIGAPALTIAAAFVVATYVLGALTLYEVHTITRQGSPAVTHAVEPGVDTLL